MDWLTTLRENLALRPWWMNACLFFCAYMTFIYVPWDFLIKPFSEPIAQAEEVWFGFMFTGWAAKATEPLHWIIYAAGTVGFWRMRPWMFPWASLYVLQIAIAMCVWQFLDNRGQGLLAGTLTAIPFLVLAIALWRAKPRFVGINGESNSPE